MKCIRCDVAFPSEARARAAMSVFVVVDEYTYSYWFCEACDVYTVEVRHDQFLGCDEVRFLPPVPKALGDRCVELVRACPSPRNRNCDCASHQALCHGLPRE